MRDKSDTRNFLSTSALAKKLDRSTQDLFDQLAQMGLIVQSGKTWQLTEAGRRKGGLYREHKDYGRYIIWPGAMVSELERMEKEIGQNLLTATALGKIFEISSTRMNMILSELGWITKGIKGWQITELGKWLNGVQSKDRVSGVPYVRWPQNIVDNKILIDSVRASRGEAPTEAQDKKQDVPSEDLAFREKFEATFRAADGHYVRSKAELVVDNWLYYSKIAHAYERKLPVEEEQYCDFFINVGKGVYIEYWGYDSDPKYLARKKKKVETYKKYSLQLIELTDKEVSSLDDVLPRKLLEFGISVE